MNFQSFETNKFPIETPSQFISNHIYLHIFCIFNTISGAAGERP
ncbi:hypothetical protein C7S16_4508 [Burkholderia thailandensis]|uniref:Uncharacterized protein n=1 Tax=Burkholderia thailandensis TaxID=57975 RepID=A0AAW9CJB3_BURTH|nr:hypothetical protein [Burkholderia thailandensis]MDW9250883.1 hypothetical protein [Burkholderia thailandensis]